MLQTGSNPNLVAPHRQLRWFGQFFVGRTVPGVVITVGDDPVRAAAPGIVHFVGQRPQQGSQTGRMYVRIAHDLYDGLKQPLYPRVTLYRHQAFRTATYGLETVNVVHWQSVRRGQIIGRGPAAAGPDDPAVKLVLEERGNPVNPDHYGTGHGFMRYGDGDETETDLEEMHRRLDRQAQIIERLNDFYSDRSQDDIYQKLHAVVDTEKFTGYPVIWSTVERFRYLVHRFGANPQLFPALSPAALDLLHREFLQNQPIVLTLPFARPK